MPHSVAIRDKACERREQEPEVALGQGSRQWELEAARHHGRYARARERERRLQDLDEVYRRYDHELYRELREKA